MGKGGHGETESGGEDKEKEEKRRKTERGTKENAKERK